MQCRLRYHQKSGVLHFLPEEEKQELRTPGFAETFAKPS